MSANACATVLHDVAPSYEDQIHNTIVVRAVATFDIPNDMGDDEALELLFRATNSVHAAWFEVCRGFNVVALGKSRSTSVGDIVAIERNGMTTYYLCCRVGWRRIGHDLIQVDTDSTGITGPS